MDYLLGKCAKAGRNLRSASGVEGTLGMEKNGSIDLYQVR